MYKIYSIHTTYMQICLLRNMYIVLFVRLQRLNTCNQEFSFVYRNKMQFMNIHYIHIYKITPAQTHASICMCTREYIRGLIIYISCTYISRDIKMCILSYLILISLLYQIQSYPSQTSNPIFS